MKMNKTSVKYMLAAGVLCAWSSVSLASNMLYSNDFNGPLGVGINALPSSTTGIADIGFLPPPNPTDCVYVEGLGALSMGCSVNHNPDAGIPGNLHVVLPASGFVPTDSNGVPYAYFSSSDSVLTLDIDMAYVHNVNSSASKKQAKFYNTDVNDSRLGWSFIALTSPDSPVNVCLGITADKIIAFVDGISQASSEDTGPAFFFIGEKELADYSAGEPVNIKIKVDKVNRTGTYLINNVPKLVVNLAGELPSNDTTVVTKTVEFPLGPRPISLERWSLLITPVLSHMDLGSVGSAKGRNTDNGLLDIKFFPVFLGLDQEYPSSFVKPFNSWVEDYAFGTTYLTIIDSIKIYSDNE